ncbi:transposase (plasmid) [Deinococcus psychrotolerans]|uniref:Transposase n=1 Tax=Deinococcus psychrotolerans TaxID=2489213 RepID=A0A3G8YJQ1_9DEIO|nr:transposase [Deinococcus psychrotolerans]
MTRGYGRAPSDQRAFDRVPRNRGRNQTLICALSLAGPQAAIVLDGVAFEWYVREILCPTLKPGQVVMMDNLSSHHRASIRTLIQAHGGEVMFTSPYSPDFNPIELMFSKLKALGRSGAWRVVTVVTELYDAIGVASDPYQRQIFNTGSNMLILRFYCDKCSKFESPALSMLLDVFHHYLHTRMSSHSRGSKYQS